jgi:hypothetical protein
MVVVPGFRSNVGSDPTKFQLCYVFHHSFVVIIVVYFVLNFRFSWGRR